MSISKRVLNAIDYTEKYRSICEDASPNAYNEICRALEKAGFKPCNSTDYCQDALKESNYKKGNKSVNVVLAYLCGYFVDITIRG